MLRHLRTSAPVALLVAACAAPASAQSAPVGPSSPTVESVLFKAADALGMLRGLRQDDSVTTLEFWATGTIEANGAKAPVAEYRGSVRFHTVPSMRADARLAGATTTRMVQAVAGALAWDESAPGIYAGPAPAGAASERLLRLLSLPQGVVKTAKAAEKQATLVSQGDKIVLTFPVAEMAGATMTATLTHQYLVERVVARAGDLTLQTEYSKYGDWNDRDYKSDVQFPQRIVQKRGEATVLDLTVTRTNTYNPYVVVPVPAALKGASPKPAQ